MKPAVDVEIHYVRCTPDTNLYLNILVAIMVKNLENPNVLPSEGPSFGMQHETFLGPIEIYVTTGRTNIPGYEVTNFRNFLLNPVDDRILTRASRKLGTNMHRKKINVPVKSKFPNLIK